jgi:tRNA(Ile)-lysidine synthase
LRAGERLGFDVLPVAMQRRCLQLQVHKLGIKTADFDLIERLRLAGDVPTCVTRDLSLVRDSRGIVQVRKEVPVAFNIQQKEVDLFGKRGIVLFNGLRIVWERRERRVGSVTRRASGHNSEVLDSETIGSQIVVRYWKPGDRFQPIGMKQSVKLQDLFTNLKVPREKRYGLVVASTADGEIFWVEGLRIGERAKVKPQTECVLRWRWRRD